MSEPRDASEKEQQRFVAATVPYAEAVLHAQGQGDVYDAASRFHSMAIEAMSKAPLEDGYLPALHSNVYLIWGALTDEMDAPGRGSPEQDAEAVMHMKQAASEWLGCINDPAARGAYLDRWVHDECGYARNPSEG